jgi:exonuclease SbcD
MGYGEATQDKKVVQIEFDSQTPTIRELPVPCFQPLERISGSLEEIQNRIESLKIEGSNAWLEIEYTGLEVIGNLRELIDETAAESSMEIRRIKNKRVTDRVISRTNEAETLDDLDVNEVFIRCLDTYDVPEEERPDIIQTYKEIIKSLQEDDINAE